MNSARENQQQGLLLRFQFLPLAKANQLGVNKQMLELPGYVLVMWAVTNFARRRGLREQTPYLKQVMMFVVFAVLQHPVNSVILILMEMQTEKLVRR